ncbi:MAG: sugar transferase [Patescibacteria group bacterium]
MLSELDGFKPRVFDVHRDQWEEMFAGMGLRGISPKTIEIRGFNRKSYEWMHSSQRDALGRLMALGALAVYGWPAMEAKRQLAAYWKGSGTVSIESGFLKADGSGQIVEGRLFGLPKLKTMKPGSENLPLGYGDSSFFGPEAAIINGDPRVTGHLPAEIRKKRLDEVPQLWEALRGRMWLVGPRSSVAKDELRDEMILYRNRFDPKMVNLKWVLESCARAMHQYTPKGGIFSPLSAYLSKKTPMDVRKIGDWAFLNCCSPLVDFAIVTSTIRRMRSGAGVQ